MNADWRPRLAVLLRGERRDDLLADLEEEYGLRAHRHGVGSAFRWYLWQVVRSIPPLAAHSLRLWVRGGPNRGGPNRAGPNRAGWDLAPIETARQWAGRAFFLFAAGWVASVIWLMQPSQFGAATLVYPTLAEPRCDCWNSYEHKFFVIALGPPLSIVFVSLTWVAMVDGRRRGRVLSS